MAPDAEALVGRRVAVLGLGAMGGSVARALKTNGVPVIGWSPVGAEREAALAAGAIDEAPDRLEDAMASVDMVVVAAPLGATCEILEQADDLASAHTVFTDVASLKVPVQHVVEATGLGARWVGSHPMCGSERSGFAASRGDMFQGAVVYLIAPDSAGNARDLVASMWRLMDATPVPIDAAGHDRLMAAVSHLPQVTANLLAEVFAEAGIGPSSLGPGGRDMTRLAGSSPDVWLDLLTAGAPHLASHLRQLARRAADLAANLEAHDQEALEDLFRRSREWGSES